MKKLLTLLLLLMVFVSSAIAGTLDDIAKRGELIVACQTQGQPFSFIDKNGKRTGSVIELCELLATEMGVKVKFIDLDWDGLIPALLSKKADMIAADMSPTIKRAMKVNFTTPFLYTGMVAFVKDDSPIKTVTDAQKSGLTAAVLLGSTGVAAATKNFPIAEQKVYKGAGSLLVDAVLKGHADFGVNDDISVVSHSMNYPPNSIRLIPTKLSRDPQSFAVRYDSEDLLNLINLFLRNAELDGRLKQNLDFWVYSLEWKKVH